jgi:hypothetical protein
MGMKFALVTRRLLRHHARSGIAVMDTAIAVLVGLAFIALGLALL